MESTLVPLNLMMGPLATDSTLWHRGCACRACCVGCHAHEKGILAGSAESINAVGLEKNMRIAGVFP